MGLSNIATELFLRFFISNPTFKDVNIAIRNRVFQIMSNQGLLNEIGSVGYLEWDTLVVSDRCPLRPGSSKPA